ncbi:MAG: Unknown protein [uncultured Sulfurovum sp.]|uniref:Uncharacterized protein n=1 Tax=uncultured Sulfurovum sp. TaxID=269237 RepID=A0A6S6RU32_9BACT|nr:MAG: Unknown protein [uncultured Sulfurovum sp.]
MTYKLLFMISVSLVLLGMLVVLMALNFYFWQGEKMSLWMNIAKIFLGLGMVLNLGLVVMGSIEFLKYQHVTYWWLISLFLLLIFIALWFMYYKN